MFDPQTQIAIGSAAAGAAAGASVIASRARRRLRELKTRLQDSADERSSVTDYVNQWVSAVTAGAGRSEIFSLLMNTARRTTGATLACLFELQEDGQLLGVASHGLFPPLRAIRSFSTRAELIEHLLKNESYKPGDGLIGMVARSLTPLLIARPEADARVYRHEDPTLQLHSLIIAPIVFQKTLYGVLALANPAPKSLSSSPSPHQRRFDNASLQVTLSLCDQAALALNNSDLMSLKLKQSRYDFDLSVASSIQTMLLPAEYPKNSQLDIDAVYHPAQKVGGDLYDIFELPEGQIGVAIADVSGKGIPASLLMAITQSHLRHLAKIHISPGKVLNELNRILQPEIRRDMFVTLTYAVIDPDGNQIIFARAGHELPLIVGPTRAEFLISEGIAIGMAPQSIFEGSLEEKRVRFVKDDRLVLFTDGLTGALNSIGEEFSAKRVAQISQQSTDGSAQELNARILSSLENFTAKRQQEDDVTLLSLKHL